MAAGDFTIPDSTGAATTELTTLFGVAQGVGDTPVNLAAGTPATHRVTAVGTVFENPGTPPKTGTVTQTLQGFYGLDQATLNNLQRQLYAGGFYGASYYGAKPKTPQFGTPDDDSFAAFKSAAVQAARSAKPLPDVISAAMASTAAGNGPGAPTQGTPTKLTNPADIRAAVVAGARAKYGHKADEKMIHDIISQYQSLETQAQESTDPRVTREPDLSSFVDQRLQSADPAAAAAHDAVGVYGDFLKVWQGAGANG